MAEKQLDLLAAGAKASAGTSPEKGGKRGGGKGKGAEAVVATAVGLRGRRSRRRPRSRTRRGGAT